MTLMDLILFIMLVALISGTLITICEMVLFSHPKNSEITLEQYDILYRMMNEDVCIHDIIERQFRNKKILTQSDYKKILDEYCEHRRMNLVCHIKEKVGHRT